MSQHICNPKHFNSVEKSLLEVFGDPKKRLYNKSIGDQAYNTMELTIRKLMNHMRELNVLAVYYHNNCKHPFSENTINLEIDYLVGCKTEYELFKGIELYNLMRSILYQIEIDDLSISLNSNLLDSFNLFNELYNDLAHNVLLNIVNKENVIYSI